ncbi:MAG: hypothetical protein M9894_05800 [Planctomycetes bacterium]|nr:hypothetical protein [Planctomycetota bacterium]
MTILVLGQPGRTGEAVGRAVAAVRQGGVDCELVEAVAAVGPRGSVLDDLVRRCQEALSEPCEPLLVRVRLSEEDAALVSSLTDGVQQDILIEATEITACADDLTWTSATMCPCDGFGCVRCLGEACP